MDVISFIVTALTAGLTAGVTESASGAVKDAYAALKNRLWAETETYEDVRTALIEFEKSPASEEVQRTLKRELAGTDVERNHEILTLARNLMESVGGLNQQGKYNISINRARGVIIGDNARVNDFFESSPTNSDE